MDANIRTLIGGLGGFGGFEYNKPEVRFFLVQ
jgi:hypothetical protein